MGHYDRDLKVWAHAIEYVTQVHSLEIGGMISVLINRLKLEK